ncbi:hypothetical protein PHISCL_09986 [Aspergillus sclerotialis]|uniref:Uncharacterized protein n=1 Tax=Aspergillus sclerotialis TaxID=2070753 RepID=A0A3A2ZEA7_9EURO|nr:hypothetical protein PHISCL_09986 [Aspergillus sclerotialis]
MAANFGATLLSEVKEEGLDELLHDLRNICPAGSEDSISEDRLGVKELDGLLDVFTPGPTVQQRLHQSSTIQREGDILQSDPDDNEGAEDQPYLVRVTRPDPVIEISSTSSGAGKSQLLYYLTAIAVLPSTYDGIDIGGKGTTVVFIDTDGRLDADRLKTVTQSILQQRFKEQPEDIQLPSQVDLDSILIASLQHVHIFRPQSSSSLLATLHTLDTYLLDTTRHHSSTRPLHTIIIDSASSFIWQDRLRDEVSRIEEIGRPPAEVEFEREQKQSFYLSDLYAELIKELKRLQRIFSCSVIYTTMLWSGKGNSSQHPQSYHPSGPFDLYNPPVVSNKTPAFRSSLPPPWGSFPLLRLVVQRDPVRPFAPGVTVREAEGDAGKRQEIVAQGKFSGWVNGWGREEWSRRMEDAVEKLNGGMFAFYSSRDGVYISP